MYKQHVKIKRRKCDDMMYDVYSSGLFVTQRIVIESMTS